MHELLPLQALQERRTVRCVRELISLLLAAATAHLAEEDKMADFVVHLGLSTGDLASALVRANTREAAIARVESARQSRTILLRGSEDKVRIVTSAYVTHYQILQRRPDTRIDYTLEAPV